MKAAGDKVMLLLVDEDAEKFFKSKGIRPSTAHATVKHLQQKPRIADMTKRADGYGFILKEDPTDAGKCLPWCGSHIAIQIQPITHCV